MNENKSMRKYVFVYSYEYTRWHQIGQSSVRYELSAEWE